MDGIRTFLLLAATVSMGLVAGVFVLYQHTIMPGLAKTDDRTFVGAFQAMDRAIMNAWFIGGGFFGALVLSAAAAIAHWEHSAFAWIAVSFGLHLLTVVVTLAINVPLNDALKAAGDPDRIADLAAVRRRFDAPRWTRWNLLRSVTTTAAFALLTWALVVMGRVT
jgi:uncharacterized membrane protein